MSSFSSNVSKKRLLLVHYISLAKEPIDRRNTYSLLGFLCYHYLLLGYCTWRPTTAPAEFIILFNIDLVFFPHMHFETFFPYFCKAYHCSVKTHYLHFDCIEILNFFRYYEQFGNLPIHKSGKYVNFCVQYFSFVTFQYKRLLHPCFITWNFSAAIASGIYLTSSFSVNSLPWIVFMSVFQFVSSNSTEFIYHFQWSFHKLLRFFFFFCLYKIKLSGIIWLLHF